MKLGGRVLGSAGCLSYPHDSITVSGNESYVWIIVTIGTVGTGMLVLAIAIVTTAFLRWHRRIDNKRRPPNPPKVIQAHLVLASV